MSPAAQTAAQLLKQYGEDAEVIATLRAAEVAAQGDVEALAHWDAVIACLTGEAPEGLPN
ncbi:MULTISPECIES: hypothetical protein [unclassified Hyphomonas]|jgi:hypothetical protein|uniref:hypothetical protein n=1 Tax=unclassified Hyphomonas TaxID=2630699 RepID=UPI000C5D4AAF|nr:MULTISPECIES: hypothetical protein [unclassified Hyphomonas]MAN92095.1 hypothetical protein [Hyphomonadaceae bacterium]MAA83245.1 hypothetical protein [Hyphomonas sp.]QSR22660.1 hypothetical protein CFA77_10170 [Hyphomonas sp. KY3]RCL89646.1 MAG: hypothetical protein DBW63_01665 [Hyphomonas sp.]HAQ76975.1 hypothetical protein [Hyphomonas sp.]|tara:strand:+ start:5212 stop:5391 length:180 start_codon:yes stop_codon:yes gene_type:complete